MKSILNLLVFLIRLILAIIVMAIIISGLRRIFFGHRGIRYLIQKSILK